MWIIEQSYIAIFYNTKKFIYFICTSFLGIIPPNEDLLFHTRNIYQVLLLCHHLGIEDVDCEKIEYEKPNNVEEQKIKVLKTWQERAERTWRDFIRALAMMKQCVLAKELAREHNVYFKIYNFDNALEMCGMTLNDYWVLVDYFS